MKNSKGLTLMELSLTIMFVSIMFMGIFNLMDTQRYVVKRLENNTAAVFFLESVRNYVQMHVANGRALNDFSSAELKTLVSRHSWEIGLELANDARGEKLVISLFNKDASAGQCAYATEVRNP